MMRKRLLLSLAALTVMLIVPAAVMAADTTTLDPGTSTDWTIWILSGLFGFFLFVLSMNTPRSTGEVEIDTIYSVMAWIPIGFCAYASFDVSRVTSTGYVTLYSYPVIGIILIVFLALAIINTIRIIALHKIFKGQEEQNG